MNLDVIVKNKDPEILVVTPLLPNHGISKVTLKTVKRNDVSIYWISTSGNNNGSLSSLKV